MLISKSILFLCSLLFMAFASISAQDMLTPVTFTWNDQNYQILYLENSQGCDLILQGKGTFNLSNQYPGENLFPQVQTIGQRIFIAWINYFHSHLSLIIYSVDRGQWLQVPMPGFKFLGHPQYLIRNQEIEGLFFLANRSRQNDIFYYQPKSKQLQNLTQSPQSEQKFQLSFSSTSIYLTTESLKDIREYHLDYSGGRVVSQKYLQKILPANRIPRSYPHSLTEEYYRSIIAFGDSITAGKMRMFNLDGYMHPELAYPEKVKEILSENYGSIYPINLGIPGNSTLDGARRIDQSLEENSGKFILIMLGTNDTFSIDFSLEASIENMEYIVIACLDRQMSPVLSTIPPRKDRFAAFEYVQNQIKEFNQAIITLAQTNHIHWINSHKAFMSDHPPPMAGKLCWKMKEAITRRPRAMK